MLSTPRVRRSQRLRARPISKAHPCDIPQDRYLASWLAELDDQSCRKSDSTPRDMLIDGEVSEADAESDAETASPPNSELAYTSDGPTNGKLEYLAGDDIHRRFSLDSRFEPGNDYERGGFVVGVNEEIVRRDSGCSFSPNERSFARTRRLIRKPVRQVDSATESEGDVDTAVSMANIGISRKRPIVLKDSSSSESASPTPKRVRVAMTKRPPFILDSSDDSGPSAPPTASRCLTTRRPRVRSSSQTRNGHLWPRRRCLLMAETAAPHRRLNTTLAIPSPAFYHFLASATQPKTADIPLTDDPEEITKCINDGIALFSRRCNRQRKPLMFILTRELSSCFDVRDALDNAVRLGMARIVDDGEKEREKEVWVVGPPRAEGKRSFSGYIV